MTFDAASYTVSEGDKQVVLMATMVGNNTVIDVTVIFKTIDDTAIGISGEREYTSCLNYNSKYSPQSSMSQRGFLLGDSL